MECSQRHNWNVNSKTLISLDKCVDSTGSSLFSRLDFEELQTVQIIRKDYTVQDGLSLLNAQMLYCTNTYLQDPVFIITFYYARAFEHFPTQILADLQKHSVILL